VGTPHPRRNPDLKSGPDQPTADAHKQSAFSIARQLRRERFTTLWTDDLFACTLSRRSVSATNV
jgi:hypothetical protein